MTLANAVASSLVSVTLFGVATSASYTASGLVDGPILLALVVGGVGGVTAGARLAPALATRAGPPPVRRRAAFRANSQRRRRQPKRPPI